MVFSQPSILVSLWRLALALITTGVVLPPAIILAIFSPKMALHFPRFWGRVLLKIFKIEAKVLDENNGDYSEQGVLFVGLNQASLIEPLFCAKLPTPSIYIVNLEFALIPLIGWFHFFVGGLIVVRQWPKQAKKIMKKAEAQLHQLANIWVSIEGRRSLDGALGNYKKGPAVLAINAQATIVPVVFYGARECLPHGNWRVRPGNVVMVLRKKISTSGLNYQDRNALVDQLRQLAKESLAHPPKI